jgi:hypothetical protein
VEFLKLHDAADPVECYRREESVVPQQALAMTNSKLSLGLARLLAHQLSQGRDGQRNREFVESAFSRILGRVPSVRESLICQRFLEKQTQLLRQAEKLTPFVGIYSGGFVPIHDPLSVAENPPELAGEEDMEREVEPAADPALRARENLVHVLFNHNDFVTIR